MRGLVFWYDGRDTTGIPGMHQRNLAGATQAIADNFNATPTPSPSQPTPSIGSYKQFQRASGHTLWDVVDDDLKGNTLFARSNVRSTCLKGGKSLLVRQVIIGVRQSKFVDVLNEKEKMQKTSMPLLQVNRRSYWHWHDYGLPEMLVLSLTES
jgi:hypothetical protein